MITLSLSKHDILRNAMLARNLWETGSIILAGMGLLHLRGTFFTKSLYPENEKLVGDMKASTLRLTKKQTMWNAWLGFNATHGLGAIFTGVANFYFALNYFELLQADHFFFVFTLLTSGFYVWVAKTYWFNRVLVLLVVAFICFMTSFTLTILK